VIASEIKMYKENPTMGLASDFAKYLYGESKIGCFDIAGEVEEVLGYKRQNVVDFRKKYLNPKEMVVVVAGNIGKPAKEIEKCFGRFKNEETVALPKVKIKMTEKKVLKVVKKETEQGHFCIGGKGIPRTDPRRYAFKLLEVILAGNTSSRLHYELREKRGWTYYIYMIGESMLEAGYWGIQSGVENDKLDEAGKVVTKEVLGIGKNGVTKEELERAKAYVLGRTELLLDRSDFWSGVMGQRMLLEGKLIDMDEELRKYQMVTLEEVLKLAGEIFVEKKLRSLVVSRS
jgi:predicted Zn-dependent peptidase